MKNELFDRVKQPKVDLNHIIEVLKKTIKDKER